MKLSQFSRPATRRTPPAALAAAALLLPLTACGGDAGAQGDGKTVKVTIGYQSKTINTVTAGTLLRELGYFERELKELGRRDGHTYKVEWQDYATGAPITAQMVAGKLDIGSMGDFPLLINASRGKQLNAPTRLVAVTGYNLRGALNTIVTKPDSQLSSVKELRGKKVSSSVGSASDGTLVRALQRAGLDPNEDVRKLNQQPAVGASALEAGSVDALSQFVAWPGLLTFQGKVRPLYDGASLNLPTFHGTVTRAAFADDRPEVLKAFLTAQIKAGDYLHEHPLEAAGKVAEATKLPPEVVYLYNGAGGIATFDPTIKPQLVAALKKDVPLLRAAKLAGPVDVDAFIDDSHLKRAYGDGYGKAQRSTANPAALPGHAATASELWLKGENRTRTFPDPGALLTYVAGHGGAEKVRAAYVPDATTGTRWFADRAVWVEDGSDIRPFVTQTAARAWTAEHSGSRIIDYAEALKAGS
ncbi:ABC transporter substrate-binding protein [Streptomyces sp. 8N616]|uniref:ABC transporter substrate-binding protein n=1 Tax=Streptomyces sp. 8N616 TaxID=3457414 RepID=UPI003FD1FA88